MHIFIVGRDEMVTVEMNPTSRVQILDKAVCILHIAINIGKAMNLTILSPAMAELGTLTLIW